MVASPPVGLVSPTDPPVSLSLPPVSQAMPGFDTRPLVTYVIPTRNEAANVEELVRRLDTLRLAGPSELVFVDDSTDDTPLVISRLESATHTIRLLHRPADRRVGGLGGAVLEGFRHARGELLLVMDSDLQHPPETSALLIDRATRRDVDLVVGSRYIEGGDAGGLNIGRELVSRSLTLTARALFPMRLRNVSDPMSGFFLVRRDAVDLDRLQPNGFKILLEIIGRSDRLAVAEVPFHFAERQAGESKASVTEMVALVETLLALRFGETARRVVRFGVVGGSGVLVNTAVLLASTNVLDLHYAIGAAVGTVVSTAWNFALTELWVFRGRSLTGSVVQRLLLFSVLGLGALAVQEPILLFLTAIVGLHFLIANGLALVTVMVLRFFVADRGIWSDAAPTVPASSFQLEPESVVTPVETV